MSAPRWPHRVEGCTCVVPAAPFVPGMLHETACALSGVKSETRIKLENARRIARGSVARLEAITTKKTGQS